MSEKAVRNIVNLSGGKDSTALAIYLRDRVPDLEYVFCDTDKELPETYEYLNRLEAYLGQPVVRLKARGMGFDHFLAMRRGFLPSARNRWCTEQLKLRPFEAFVGTDVVCSYIGIRADEQRIGYISHRPNIKALFPFKKEGIGREDVLRILDRSGLGMPAYYRWRSRSGCYFCFFQQKIEWLGLLENHPDLFQKAKAYENMAPKGFASFTWSDGESLDQLAEPGRIAEIRAQFAAREATERERRHDVRLVDLFEDIVADESMERACLICDL
ncbi:MAG: phosphoadenosine phosphosulfate reductase family protein [Deltaproteobacteria bacterium]|nr:phosphoadenosine phosphosulfate reductase family protein [Deltaproteobacteria bacterium]